MEITLDGLVRQWHSPSKNALFVYGDLDAYRRHLWQTLVCPQERGFFNACKLAMEKNPEVLAAWLQAKPEPGDRIGAILGHGGPDVFALIHAHLLCALILHEKGSWISPTVDPPVVSQVAKQLEAYRPFDERLSEGFLQDLMQEMLGGIGRPPERAQEIDVPLIDEATGEGVMGTVTLEWISKGTGAFYPTASLALVIREKEFNEGLVAARTASERLVGHSWNGDVRWSLRRKDRQPIATRLRGGSAGGGIALALSRLLARDGFGGSGLEKRHPEGSAV